VPRVDRSRAGGTLRQEMAVLPFDNSLDPSSEYTSFGFALHSNVLSRTLLNYRHVAGTRGSELLPDLAEALPEISEDGLNYTFTLREDASFGPPLNRDITSADVRYAFERVGTPRVGAGYSFYYESAIEGFSEFATGAADEISGIETPDDDTIVFHLIQPTGDFLYRLAMPAVAPIPQEIARCFPAGEPYGRHLVSSGPYMIEGSDAAEFRTCSQLEPFSGFEPDEHLFLVRNPSFRVADDDPRIRESLPDRFEFVAGVDDDAILRNLKNGRSDVASGSPSFDTLREYAARPQLRKNLHVEAGDQIWYITMNLSVPPFDDVHVRRAVSYVMDKDSLVRAWGGPLQGNVSRHVLPEAMIGGRLEGFDPYRSPDNAGNLARAKAEMRRSRYDSNGDGLCDRPACDGVVHVGRDVTPWSSLTLVIEASLQKLGISVDTSEPPDPYGMIQQLPNRVALTSIPGWGKDYPDPYSFIGFLFDGRNIDADTNANYSLVGLTEARAAALRIDYPRSGIPSVDADIDACAVLLPGDERLSCWVELDRKLMTEVVPWIPYLDANRIVITSDDVRPYEFDQFSGELSYAHVGVRLPP
jgi:peptide/nickel transport system substrate-binding protein